MIHELRIYTTPPGQAPILAKYSSEIGRPIRGDDYGKLEGYWMSEIGPLNQVAHLWTYDDLNDRQAKRAALGQNERWKSEFLSKAGPLILRQDIRLMTPFRSLAPPTGEGHVFEYRHYRTKVGKPAEWAGYFNEAMAVREKYSKCVGGWITVAGQPNEVSHLWAYESLNHRAEARAGAAADPGWQAFLAKGGPLLEEMHSLVMLPTAGSPMK